MSQIVTGPDGQQHEFPDEATPEQIKRAMQQHAQPQGQGGPEAFAPTDPDPYQLQDLEKLRSTLVEKHGIASDPTLAPHPSVPAPQAAPQPQASPQAGGEPLWAQFGGRAIEGALGLPGLPVDAIVGGGNFVRRQFDLPETQLEDTPARDWGSRGWAAFAKRNMYDPLSKGDRPLSEFLNVKAPETDIERLVQKGGSFAGGGAVAGPAAMIPTATAFAGSEAGRTADINFPEVTKGYGEFGGGLVGGALPGVKRMISKPLDRSAAPSVDDVEAQAQAEFKRSEDAGLIIKPDALQRSLGELKDELAQFGYDKDLHPGGTVGLRRLQEAADSGENITLKGVDIIRRVARDAGTPGNWKDAKVSQKIVKNIDRMITNLGDDDVLAGDRATAIAALNKARALWARKSKGELIAETLDKAVRQTQRAHSGGNIDNAIRQKFDALLNRKAFKRLGFTADEEAMIRKVVSGRSNTQEFLRWAGKMSPRGGGLNTLLTLAGIGGASYVAPPAAPFLLGGAALGAVARPIADAMTKGNVRRLSDAVLRGNVYKTPKRMTTAPKPGATGRMLTPPR